MTLLASTILPWVTLQGCDQVVKRHRGAYQRRRADAVRPLGPHSCVIAGRFLAYQRNGIRLYRTFSM
jgi:hypothetical protein